MEFFFFFFLIKTSSRFLIWTVDSKLPPPPFHLYPFSTKWNPRKTKLKAQLLSFSQQEDELIIIYVTKNVTLVLPSSFPSSAMNCATWDPNPPIEPSSTVIRNAWFSQSCLISLMSRGLQNLASATVTSTPSFERRDRALRQFWTIAPYPSKATSLPSERTFPFPICSRIQFCHTRGIENEFLIPLRMQ